MPIPRTPAPRALYGAHLADDRAVQSHLRGMDPLATDRPSDAPQHLFLDYLLTETFGVFRAAHSAPRVHRAAPATSDSEPLTLIIAVASGQADVHVPGGSYSLSVNESLIIPEWAWSATSVHQDTVVYGTYTTRARVQAITPAPVPCSECIKFGTDSHLLAETLFSVCNVLLNAQLPIDDPQLPSLRLGVEAAIAVYAQSASGFRAADPLETAHSLISQHFRNPEFSAHRLAEDMNISRAQLYRLFHEHPRTPREQILHARLQCARETGIDLAHATEKELRTVAERCGFRSAQALKQAHTSVPER